ncbi:MAG: GFA family protein [Myxococcales bacterium]|nr:GFA family protein [Myxococcales bacterium]
MTTKHRGSCHCGKVQYEVEVDLESPVVACNCSMCGRSGTLLSFVPGPAFSLLSGDDVLTDYRFNKHVIDHLFCSICGIKPFARGTRPDGTPTVAINVRCLEGVDLETLKVQKFDGRSY